MNLYNYCVGLQISGNDIPLTVGDTATLTCSTDLKVSSIQWWYSNQILAESTEQSAQLVFSPVNDSIHGKQYTCRVNSPYGIQEERATITVACELVLH